MNIYELKEKTAIVTGGGSGIGFGICEALCDAGANVVIGDYKQALAMSAAEKLNAKGYLALGVHMDATDPDSFSECMKAGNEKFGTLDILVNNAGITISEDVFAITKTTWDKVFDLNTRGLFLCSQAFAKFLVDHKKGGSIVNIASNAAKVTFIGQVHYNASKAAVVNITQSLAKEFAQYKINVNAVCPGACDTDMLRDCMIAVVESAKNPNITIESLRKDWSLPQLGRLSQPIDIGRVVVFLASEAAVIIRGQSISVDAGSTPY
jgi:NAD(P)-dependent dehydrogenase (short-subunit alcohol dehydrogenase family)